MKSQENHEIVKLSRDEIVELNNMVAIYILYPSAGRDKEPGQVSYWLNKYLERVTSAEVLDLSTIISEKEVYRPLSKSLLSVIEFAATDSSLHTLILTGNPQVTTEDYLEVIKILPSLRSLRSLSIDLKYNTELAKAFTQIPSLCTLNLSSLGTPLEDEKLAMIKIFEEHNKESKNLKECCHVLYLYDILPLELVTNIIGVCENYGVNTHHIDFTHLENPINELSYSFVSFLP